LLGDRRLREDVELPQLFSRHDVVHGDGAVLERSEQELLGCIHLQVAHVPLHVLVEFEGLGEHSVVQISFFHIDENQVIGQLAVADEPLGVLNS